MHNCARRMKEKTKKQTQSIGIMMELLRRKEMMNEMG